ncbi:MAG TPA: murein transglycosylase [Planctomycetes bacterium]|nr:murein transglycosylase [Planctomycetota bacterium]
MKQAATVLALAGLASCAAPVVEEVDPFAIELPPGELGLEPLPDGTPWPDFSIGWAHREDLALATEYSLDYLAKPTSEEFFPYGPITHERMVKSLERFGDLVRESTDAEAFRESLTEEFEVWMARGRSDEGEVMFTGYCTPILKGSLEPTDVFKYPLFKKPEDLVKGKDGAILGRRTAGGGLAPYWTTRELHDGGHLKGLELLWLDDAFDAYIAQVQGSALIELPDGSQMEIGYSATNGQEYKSVGKMLLDKGLLKKSELSLARMREFFASNPEAVDEILPLNPRFVFFQASDGGPFGCLGQPVTALHSLATDKDVFPRAALAYAEVRLPDYNTEGKLVQRPMRFFALDQDRGGAIRSAGRCDVFIGVGPEAVARAGHVLSMGRLYYLFLKG